MKQFNITNVAVSETGTLATLLAKSFVSAAVVDLGFRNGSSSYRKAPGSLKTALLLFDHTHFAVDLYLSRPGCIN